MFSKRILFFNVLELKTLNSDGEVMKTIIGFGGLRPV